MGAVNKIQCDGPGCKAVKAESNHWLGAIVRPTDYGVYFDFGPLVDGVPKSDVLTFCGVPCALRKMDEFLQRIGW